MNFAPVSPVRVVGRCYIRDAHGARFAEPEFPPPDQQRKGKYQVNAAEAFRIFIDHSTIADKRKGELANRYLDTACSSNEDEAARALFASLTEDERAEMKRLGLTLEPA